MLKKQNPMHQVHQGQVWNDLVDKEDVQFLVHCVGQQSDHYQEAGGDG